MEIIVFNFGENKERYHEKLKFLGPVFRLGHSIIRMCKMDRSRGIDHRCRPSALQPLVETVAEEFQNETQADLLMFKVAVVVQD